MDIFNNIFKKIINIFKNYFFIISNVRKAAPKELGILVFIAVFSALLPIVPLYLMKEVMNTFTSSQIENISAKIIGLLSMAAVVNFLSRFTNCLREYFSANAVHKVEKYINIMIMRKASSIDMYTIESKDYYYKLDNAKRVLGRRWDQLVLAPINSFAHFITLVGLILILSKFRVYLVIIILLGTIPNVFTQIKIRNDMNEHYTSQLNENRKISYIEYILTNKSFAKEIRIYSISNKMLNRFSKIFDKRHKKLIKVSKKSMQRNSLVLFISFISMGICQIIIALEVLKGKLRVGDWTLYTGTLAAIEFNLGVVIGIIVNSYEEKLFGKVLMEFLNIESEKQKSENCRLKSAPNKITFEDVWFKYPDTTEYVIRGVNLTIDKGEKIGLVGLNGSGKSTLVKLLVGIYEPTKGRIYFDGIDIKKIRKSDIYRIFSIIFQDFCKYAFTISENISISNIEKFEDTNKVKKWAKISGADDFIKSLDSKYETYVTKDYSQTGVGNLSGGEWQKVAISRALFRESNFMIFDEPTSSLDPIAENEIYNNFMELCKNRNVLMISHRLANIRKVDKILMMDKGKIIERGTHVELINKNGKYKDMYLLQAEKYFDISEVEREVSALVN